MTGSILGHLFRKDFERVGIELADTRTWIQDQLSVTLCQSSQQTYGLHVQLHMLTEVEEIVDAVQQPSILPSILDLWNSRYENLSHGLEGRHKVLTLRRALLDLARGHIRESEHEQTIKVIDSENIRLWLEAARDARKAGKFMVAQDSLAHLASRVPRPEKGTLGDADVAFCDYVIQGARLRWAQGDSW